MPVFSIHLLLDLRFPLRTHFSPLKCPKTIFCHRASDGAPSTHTSRSTTRPFKSAYSIKCLRNVPGRVVGALPARQCHKYQNHKCWIKKTCLRGFANNQGADQSSRLCSLISAFVIRLKANIASPGKHIFAP